MIRQIPVKLPESFEEALGYPGQLKWAAFYWEPCGDEAVFDDGVCSGDGNWWGFLQFVRHPNVSPWLSDCDLGSSDEEANHWLLCDLENRDIYVGEKQDVRTFLHLEARKVLPESPEINLEMDDAYDSFREAILKAEELVREVPTPSMREIEEKMRRDQEAVEKMVAELGR
jgi:hypothetical protein